MGEKKTVRRQTEAETRKKASCYSCPYFCRAVDVPAEGEPTVSVGECRSSPPIPLPLGETNANDIRISAAFPIVAASWVCGRHPVLAVNVALRMQAMTEELLNAKPSIAKPGPVMTM